MGETRPPDPVKLFVGLLSSIPGTFAETEAILIERWGPVDLRSEPFAFDETQYYDESMGTPIERRFIAFETLIGAEELARIKIATNGVEASFQAGGKGVSRPVNLDPGYMEVSKIVLASTKNFYHRILLGEAIYGEVTLHFETGHWQAFPWTFPDFRSGRYDGFFNAMRALYRAQLGGHTVKHRGRF